MKEPSRAKRLPLAMLAACFLFVLVPFSLVGCSGGRIAVTGKVTSQGKAVTGGTLVFSPVGDTANAKAASGQIQKDGSFTLGTKDQGDGIVAGHYRVTFSPPEQELTEAQRSDPKYIAPPPMYMGLAPKTAEVDISAGNNTLTIELVPAKK